MLFVLVSQEERREMSGGFRGQAKSSGTFNIAKGAVVCVEAQLIGNITIGARTVVHPSAKILAEGGPIIIGEGNLIQEKAVIINKKVDGGSEVPMVIGDGNVFSISSYVECTSIGNTNTFEPKSVVSRYVTVSNGCVIGAACRMNSKETLPENTIIYSPECKRYCKKVPLQTSDQQQLEYLIKVLPNYHHLIRSTPS